MTLSAVEVERCCDLLLSFPAAAICGVHWSTLARKYEERHDTPLALTELGHTSPLTDALPPMFLDTLRVLDAEVTDNPLLALKEKVSLMPRPGFLGTWPSLYSSLVRIVRTSGICECFKPSDKEVHSAVDVSANCLLLSKLKPLLQTHWHPDFDELGLGYLREDGSYVRIKKMKQLVRCVLQWREQRVLCQRSSGSELTGVDEVLAPRLDMILSKKHNDLMLCCVVPGNSGQAGILPNAEDEVVPGGHMSFPIEQKPRQRCDVDEVLAQELAHLRAENAMLRAKNQVLCLQQGISRHQIQSLCAPSFSLDLLNDPFEPPPERLLWQQAPLLYTAMPPTCPCLTAPSDITISSTQIADVVQRHEQ